MLFTNYLNKVYGKHIKGYIIMKLYFYTVYSNIEYMFDKFIAVKFNQFIKLIGSISFKRFRQFLKKNLTD